MHTYRYEYLKKRREIFFVPGSLFGPLQKRKRQEQQEPLSTYTYILGWLAGRESLTKETKKKNCCTFALSLKEKNPQKQKSMKSECVSVCVWAAVGRTMTHIRDPNGFV
jgi:hypothetical protein